MPVDQAHYYRGLFIIKSFAPGIQTVYNNPNYIGCADDAIAMQCPFDADQGRVKHLLQLCAFVNFVQVLATCHSPGTPGRINMIVRNPK